jgi:hypothetical protein
MSVGIALIDVGIGDALELFLAQVWYVIFSDGPACNKSLH